MEYSFEHLLLHISLIDGVGPATVQAIVNRMSQASISWDIVCNFRQIDWMQQCGFSETLALAIERGLRNKNLIDQELHHVEKHNFQWTTFCSDDYPELLKHIHNPPSILYWQGNVRCLDAFTLAIVGSRKANLYAQDVINTVVPSFVQHGWTIVSGGALGADSMAHNATLKAGGKTVAILGSGLLHQYPASNKKMFTRIVEHGGAIVSSFSVDTPAYPTNFPIRNRIVSGVSKGCLVVQAAEKSGARITAQYALDQGRDVFAIPGSIKDPLSKGCHDLIHLGAKLIHTAEDVISEYGILHKTERNYVQSTILDTKENVAYNTPAANIIAACAQPQSVESLMMHTQYSLPELQVLLFELQLDGKIKQDFTGMWSIYNV